MYVYCFTHEIQKNKTLMKKPSPLSPELVSPSSFSNTSNKSSWFTEAAIAKSKLSQNFTNSAHKSTVAIVIVYKSHSLCVRAPARAARAVLRL